MPRHKGEGMTELKLTDAMVTAYRDGRSENEKDYARENLEDMADMILAVAERMWSAPAVSRLALGGEAFMPHERKALVVMQTELRAMHRRLNTLRDAIERGDA